MVSTMDVLSSGRAVLGVGAGWSQTEFEGYSTWDDSKTRVEKTKEGVELILQLWQKPQVDFKGKYYHARGAIL
jgi:alkanesulfonate monooxygenase SsuD/methylene tetrahydromethanopterin reductase-like flavin-dependent oxidoreductase (luciferase family)